MEQINEQNLAFKTIKTLVSPLIGDVLNFNTAANILVPEKENAVYPLDLPFEANISFEQPWEYIVFSKISLSVVNNLTDTPDLDHDGVELTRIFFLPVLKPGASSILHFKVLAALKIDYYNRSGVSCYFPAVEGSDMTLRVSNNPFTTANIQYDWFVDNVNTGNKHKEKLELINLPNAGASFKVKVTITNLDDGSEASGSRNFVIYSQRQSEVSKLICNISHILYHQQIKGLINPLGPDDPAFHRLVEKNIGEIANNAKRIAELSGQYQNYDY